MSSDPSRKCFRLIGGVLVQRTVKDVVPALETNYTGIKEVLETLVKTYKTKEEEFAAFQREHKIVVSMRAPGRGGPCSFEPLGECREQQADGRCPDANNRIVVSDPCIPCIWLSSDAALLLGAVRAAWTGKGTGAGPGAHVSWSLTKLQSASLECC